MIRPGDQVTLLRPVMCDVGDEPGHQPSPGVTTPVAGGGGGGGREEGNELRLRFLQPTSNKTF